MSAVSRPALTYVVNSLNPGGTERLVVEMSCAFSQEYALDVLCLDTPGAWADSLRRRGVSVRALWRQPGFDASMPGKLARHFREQGTRIVHAHQCTAWFYAALSRLLNPTPRLLLEEHGRFYPEITNRARICVNKALIKRLTHRFVAVSRDVRERLQRYEGLDSRQIEVIYNGVAPITQLSRTERASLREQLGFTPTDFVVGTVGRFDPIKNLPMLIDALAAASEQNGAVRGLLIGAGPVFDAVQRRLSERGLANKVVLTGHRDDARRLVQCFDLFVLSSFSEGTSMALLEAMAAGVPAAVTEVGGNPEIVLREQTGWTVPSGSVPALARVLLEAARNPGLRERLAQHGQKRFEEQFSLARMLDAYRGSYTELLAMRA